MKTKRLHIFMVAFLVMLFSTSSFCSQKQNEFAFGEYIAMQNAVTKYVREKIADESVLTVYVKPLILITSTDEKAKDEKPTIYRCPTSSIGGGSIIREDGYLLTVAHLTNTTEEYADCLAEYLKKSPDKDKKYSPSVEYKFILAGTEKFFGELIAVDEKNDLAILRITDRKVKMKPVVFTNRIYFSDEMVAIIGAPSGLPDMIVLGKVARPEPHKPNHIMIAAPIYPGNSGGVAVDLRDMTIIGLIDEVMLNHGQYMNYGCAIAPDVVKKFIKETMQGR